METIRSGQQQGGEDDGVEGDVVLGVDIVVQGVGLLTPEGAEILPLFFQQGSAHGEIAQHVFGPDIDFLPLIAWLGHVDTPV